MSVELRTLRDFTPAHAVHAFCPRCRHHAVLNPLAVANIAGWDVPLPALRRGLKCSQCGHRGADIRIVHSGRVPIAG